MRVLDSILDFDRRSLLLLQHSQSWVARRRRSISRSADGPLYGVAVALLACTDLVPDHFLVQAVAAFGVERLIYWLMKNSLRRKRPAAALVDFESHIVPSDEFSFPSGHTSAAFLFATLMVLSFGPLMLALYAWSGAVGMSRVYLGVHFPTDTVVGAVLGVSIAFASASWFI